MKKPGEGLGVDIGFSRLFIDEASAAWNALISYICCFRPVSDDVVSIFVIVSFVDLATMLSCSLFDCSISVMMMMGSLKDFVINESEYAWLLNSLLYY